MVTAALKSIASKLNPEEEEIIIHKAEAISQRAEAIHQRVERPPIIKPTPVVKPLQPVVEVIQPVESKVEAGPPLLTAKKYSATWFDQLRALEAYYDIVDPSKNKGTVGIEGSPVTFSYGVAGSDTHKAGEERETVTTYKGSSTAEGPDVIVRDIETQEVIATGTKEEVAKISEVQKGKYLTDAEVREIAKDSSMSPMLAAKIYGSDVPETVTISKDIYREGSLKRETTPEQDEFARKQGLGATMSAQLAEKLYGEDIPDVVKVSTKIKSPERYIGKRLTTPEEDEFARQQAIGATMSPELAYKMFGSFESVPKGVKIDPNIMSMERALIKKSVIKTTTAEEDEFARQQGLEASMSLRTAYGLYKRKTPEDVIISKDIVKGPLATKKEVSRGIWEVDPGIIGAENYYVYLHAKTDEWTEAESVKQARAMLLESQKEYLREHKHKIGDIGYKVESASLHGMNIFPMTKSLVNLAIKSPEATEEYLSTKVRLTKGLYAEVDTKNVMESSKRFAMVGGLKGAEIGATAFIGGGLLKGGIMTARYGLIKAGSKAIKVVSVPVSARTAYTYTGLTTPQIVKGWLGKTVGTQLKVAGAYIEPVALTSMGVVAGREIAPKALGGKSESFAHSVAIAAEMAVATPFFIGGFRAPVKVKSMIESPFGKKVPVEALVEKEVLSGVEAYPRIKERETIDHFKRRFEQTVPELGEITPGIRGFRAMTTSLKEVTKEGIIEVPARQRHPTMDPPGWHYSDVSMSPYFLGIPKSVNLIDIIKIPSKIKQKVVDLPKFITGKPILDVITGKYIKPKSSEYGLVGKIIEAPQKTFEFLYGKESFELGKPSILRTESTGITQVPKSILQLEKPRRSRSAMKETQKYVLTKAEKGKMVITRDVEWDILHKARGQFSEVEVVIPKGSLLKSIGKPWYRREYTSYRGQRIPIHKLQEISLGKLTKLKTENLIAKRKKLTKKQKELAKREFERKYDYGNRRVEKIPLYGISTKYKAGIKRYTSPIEEYKQALKQYQIPTKQYPTGRKKYPTRIKQYPTPIKSYPLPTTGYPLPTKGYPIPDKTYPVPEKTYPVDPKTYPPPIIIPPTPSRKKKDYKKYEDPFLNMKLAMQTKDHFVGGWEQFFKKPKKGKRRKQYEI